MAIYKVQSDGKAQKGLKKGDEVVTGGGTYRITGVNADGSYKSEKVSNETTSTYKGSYANSGGSSGGGGSSSGGGSSNKNSQYTGSSTGIKTYNSTQQDIKNQMNANSIAWWSADETERKRLEAENQRLSQLLGGSVSYNPTTGTWSGTADGSFEDVYEEENQRPEAPKSDPRIDAILNEILNRDGFSYDAMNDPLYQQYADMYRREGDRAMKETMAEAAAGAGGMNTYAITAAQQANNYYNSKLNDIIPELYGVAYDKYLKDIDLKIQDLGILQDMDATQYDRYRDTMDDWQKDRNFAYGVYYDDVQQGNWQANFDNNNFWKNKDFDYNEFWDNKKWNANEEDKIYDRNQSEQDEAKAEVEYWMEKGIMPDEATIAKSGMNRANIEKRVAQVQAEQLAKGTSSGGGSSGGSSGGSGNGSGGSGDDDPKGIDYDYIAGLEKGSENYMSTDEACAQIFEKEGWAGVQKLLNELREEKEIDQSSYMMLYNKYRDK